MVGGFFAKDEEEEEGLEGGEGDGECEDEAGTAICEGFCEL